MNEKNNTMSDLLTPADLAAQKVASLTQQWKDRNAGRLRCYRLGRKVMYSQQHIADYLAVLETPQTPARLQTTRKEVRR